MKSSLAVALDEFDEFDLDVRHSPRPVRLITEVPPADETETEGKRQVPGRRAPIKTKPTISPRKTPAMSPRKDDDCSTSTAYTPGVLNCIRGRPKINKPIR
jgi:hypothetical protein